MGSHQAHSSQVICLDNELNQHNLEILSNPSSTRRTIRGSEKINLGKNYTSTYDKLASKQVPQVQVNLRSINAQGGSQMTNRRNKPKSSRESLDYFQKNRSLKSINRLQQNNVHSDFEENEVNQNAYIQLSKRDRGLKDTQEMNSIESVELD